MKRFKKIFRNCVLMPVLALCSCNSMNNSKYVNVFLGSAGDHGQMTPGAAVPFGMISVCPDSEPGQHGGYDYNVPEISGVSINRISGVGCGGTGSNISVRPASADEDLKIVKGTEKAHPGYYETTFSNDVKGMFTATKNMAVEKYIFPEGAEKILEVDFASSVVRRPDLIDCRYNIESSDMISGWVKAPTACSRGSYVLHFAFHTDSEFDVAASDSSRVVLRFDSDEVEVRIAVSPVDQYAADTVLEGWEDYSFSQIHDQAVAQWESKFDKVKVQGSTQEQKALLYTFLYRLYLSPMDVSSDDGRYKGTDGEIYHSDTHRYYSSWSMWDTFRSKFPLLAILEPEVMNDICWSLTEQFRCGKQNWATPHESVPTVRTEHSVIMLLDCWKKGITGFPLVNGYEGMKLEAATGLPMRSPDQVLESSYDLWALSQISDIIGRKEDAAVYRAKADSLFYDVWPREFMTIGPDFTKMRDNGLYQGSRWQYRWAAPHYLSEMIELAGAETLEAQLDYFFENNLLNQGNEPCLHIPFIYNLLGSPEKTQAIVRRLLTDEQMVHLYGGNAEYPEPFVGRAFQNKMDGFAPEMDEDDGAMSAWYIFCSLGFYPVRVGTDTYEVYSPLFDRIVIDNGNAKVEIVTKGRKNPDDVIKSIKVNGQVHEGWSLTHDIFREDTEVTLIY